MKGVYTNFQVLFFGLLGLLAIGGHHFNAESYEIYDTTASNVTPVETVELPNSPYNTELATDLTLTPATQAKNQAQKATLATKSTSVKKSSTPVAKQNTTALTQATFDNISIGGRTIRIKSVSDTTVDAGRMVAKYGNKFLYGHNSSTVFGHLHTLSVGSTFTVTLGGQTTTYRIAKAVTLEKHTQVAPIMYPIAQAKYSGQTYDLSIMTCAGVSYGNGDASHRLIIFANRL